MFRFFAALLTVLVIQSTLYAQQPPPTLTDELVDEAMRIVNEELPFQRRNGKLAGKNHPVTNIPFDADGFADFSGVATHTVRVRCSGNNATDFAAANNAAGFTTTPSGWTWHHCRDGQTMQLVPTEIHRLTGHSGGMQVRNVAVNNKKILRQAAENLQQMKSLKNLSKAAKALILVDILFRTYGALEVEEQFKAGNITDRDRKILHAKNAGGIAGGLLGGYIGADLGAKIGVAGGPPGVIAGGLIGGVIGYGVGELYGEEIAGMVMEYYLPITVINSGRILWHTEEDYRSLQELREAQERFQKKYNLVPQ